MSGLSTGGRIYLMGSSGPIKRHRAFRLSGAEIVLLESDFV